jgi:hypothetical protein
VVVIHQQQIQMFQYQTQVHSGSRVFVCLRLLGHPDCGGGLPVDF